MLEKETRSVLADILLLGGLTAVATTLCAFFFGFTIDDAFITLRYAENLAAGKGIIWNIGADPVEGYTSTLWVFIAAIPHAVGLSPIYFVKIVGVLSLLTVIFGVYISGIRMGVSRWFVISGVAVLALNPAIALLAVQGMETATAMVFVFIAAISSLRLTNVYKRRDVIILYSGLFLGMVTRPDLVAFAAGLLVTLAYITYRRNGISTTTRLIGWGVALLLLPGLAFIGIRTAYFGYPFPNSFYVKEAGGLLSLSGIAMVVDFVAVVLGPLLATTLAIKFYDSDGELTAQISKAGPIIGGVIAFLPVWIFIDSIQGYLWRFQAPIIPAILLTLFIFIKGVNFPSISNIRETMNKFGHLKQGRVIRALFLFLLVVFLVIFPLHTFDNTIQEQAISSPEDRIQMGQELEPLSDDGYRMLVTESGAVPYYSGWHAVDVLGLNSEAITHGEQAVSYFRDYNPDLIMSRVGSLSTPTASEPALARTIQNGKYQLVSVVQKTGTDDYHAYFVAENSSGKQEITCAVRTAEQVTYVDPAPLASLWDTPLAEATCDSQ